MSCTRKGVTALLEGKRFGKLLSDLSSVQAVSKPGLSGSRDIKL